MGRSRTCPDSSAANPVERLLRLENLWVLALILVAVLVGLGARWRDDPRRGGFARAANALIRIGLFAIVAAIALFFGLILVLGPIGGP